VTHLRILAASRVGTAHHDAGSERQDRVRVVDIDGVLAVAVADGVGSASHGAQGAEAAVSGATDFLTTLIGPSASRRSIFGESGQGDLRVEPADDALSALNLDWRTVVIAALAYGRQKVFDEASAHGVPLGQLATTLTVCVVVHEELHCAQIGDGYAVAWKDDEHGSVHVLASREDAEQDPSIVIPVTAAHALRSVSVASFPFGAGYSALITTDGIAPILLDRWIPPHPSHRFIRAIGERLRSGTLDSETLGDFLASSLVVSRTDDDKSVVLITWDDPQHVAQLPPKFDAVQPLDSPAELASIESLERVDSEPSVDPAPVVLPAAASDPAPLPTPVTAAALRSVTPPNEAQFRSGVVAEDQVRRCRENSELVPVDYPTVDNPKGPPGRERSGKPRGSTASSSQSEVSPPTETEDTDSDCRPFWSARW
jgi:hypothetical protein